MSVQARSTYLLLILALSGCFAGALVWLSPNPMPMAHTQLLTACIALFSFAGATLVRMLNAGLSKEIKKTDTHISPSIEGPDGEVLPPLNSQLAGKKSRAKNEVKLTSTSIAPSPVAAQHPDD